MSEPSLADALAAVTPFSVRACRVYGAMVERPDDADTIWEACTGSKLPASAVARVLTQHGIEVTASTVKRHRRQECRCPQMLKERYV